MEGVLALGVAGVAKKMTAMSPKFLLIFGAKMWDSFTQRYGSMIDETL